MFLLSAILFLALLCSIGAFTTTSTVHGGGLTARQPATKLFLADEIPGDKDIIAKRITVKGDVQGGYYRSCVRNEAARFRRLVGTMSPPDDSKEAEIYVEGSRKMVDGFIRWCQRGSVGLSQVVEVSSVAEEDPTGLYDGFYVKTK